MYLNGIVRNFDNLLEVGSEVDNKLLGQAFTGETGAATPGGEAELPFAGILDEFEQVFLIDWCDDSQWQHAEDAGIRGEQATCRFIDPYLAFQYTAQIIS